MAQNQTPANRRKPAEWFYLVAGDRFPLFEFPTWLIAVLVIGVFIAFGLAGFFGYRTDTYGYILNHAFGALFLWFAIITLAILWTIFKRIPKDSTGYTDKAAGDVLRWRWWITGAALFFMLVDAVIYTQPGLLHWITEHFPVVRGGQFFWNVVNFGTIGWFLADRLVVFVSWLRSSPEKAAQTEAEETRGQRAWNERLKATRLFDQPLIRYEVVSHNAFAGAALCFALGGVLQADLLNAGLQRLNRPPIDPCALTVLSGTCQNGATSNNSPTLHTIDWALGSVVLLITGVIVLTVVIIKILYVLRNMRFADALVTALLQTLRSLGILLALIVPNLRAIFWPAFLWAGITLAGATSWLVERYLHVLSDQQTCPGSPTCPDVREFSFFLGDTESTKVFLQQAFGIEVRLLALILVCGAVGLIFVLAAARALLFGRFDGSIVKNWFEYVWKMGLFVACIFWVFSLLLCLLDFFTQLTNLTPRMPFPHPGISTAVSGAVFLVTCVILLVSQRGRLTGGGDDGRGNNSLGTQVSGIWRNLRGG